MSRGRHAKPSQLPAHLRRAAFVGGTVASTPLLLAPTAHADAPDPVTVAPQSAPAPVAAPAAVPTSEYVVQAGDWLSTIAPRVGEDWHKLFEDNRAVIGDDPNVIFPGQRLIVGGLALPTAPVTGTAVVPGGHITQEFSLGGHDGIDIGAPVGTPIHAVASGTVTASDDSSHGGFGSVVYIEGDDGKTYWYGHMSARHVSVGDRVEVGQHIADVGARGNSTGPHLHLEVHVGPGPINPRSVIEAAGLSLT